MGDSPAARAAPVTGAVAVAESAAEPVAECAALRALRYIQDLFQSRPPKPPAEYPSISSIPLTSLERLSQPDASPSTGVPDEPIPASTFTFPPDVKSAPPSGTVLYLAYGSNLCAQTFLGQRGIRPLSQVNVSAPSLRLTFDLPGLPYKEPCFANTAPRKLPTKPPGDLPTPPKLPPGLPDPPKKSPKLPHWQTVEERDVERNAAGDPVWNKGLIGVVYEVTQADYAKIVATEGGGASYLELLVPCLTLPARIGVPRDPSPVPELPKPFLAHTLYAPRLPLAPPDNDTSSNNTPPHHGAQDVGNNGHAGGDGEGDDGDGDKKPEAPGWFRRLLLPVRRPDPDYSQPSARYLKLITDGAKEHDLPADYQRYLNALQPYTITTRRQQIGQVLFFGFWMPFFLLFIFVGPKLFADKKGRIPKWLAASLVVLSNVLWLSYDKIAKPLFGDGERTEQSKDEAAGEVPTERKRRESFVARLRHKEASTDEEKRCLIGSQWK
ncbi:hypothetical protein QBC46DRAFT_383731 [Diplogelasinospora grovesii]|uniref:gamma-glutamylcyclotransferase n=1 Tax=Diplogelasinospora grovesii TaxID=303347 RepID=A0AAN6N8G2_9PEZI|nr:hypothetical protein QBC46DRAFT_383731 [Diplogelasinospora grovesii]